MPELAKEWAHKTDYTKIPEKVRKKKNKKDKGDCGEKALQLADKFERSVKASSLPDGSGFFTASYPLPEDHWLFSDIADALPIEASDPEKKQQEAARYAIRAATNNGKIVDFDPDAMVQNFLVAMR
jgi:hypothetical protein